MNNNERGFSILLMLAALLPFLSWALSALGLPCRSILDDEGLRWLFRHLSDCLHSQLVMFVLCFLMMQGVIKESGILPLSRAFRDTKFLRYLAVYSVVLISVMLVAVAPDSPLLSVTGGIAGSPLLDGLPFFGWFSFIAFCLCYGHNKCESWPKMLTYGIRSYPLAIPFAIILSFCWQCIQYMIDSF